MALARSERLLEARFCACYEIMLVVWTRSSAVEHYVDIVGVTGSIPVVSTIKNQALRLLCNKGRNQGHAKCPVKQPHFLLFMPIGIAVEGNKSTVFALVHEN